VEPLSKSLPPKPKGYESKPHLGILADSLDTKTLEQIETRQLMELETIPKTEFQIRGRLPLSRLAPRHATPPT
jgi:hypothetical protein